MLGTAHIAGKVYTWSFGWPAEASARQDQPVHFAIGPTRFELPLNLIATAFQKRQALGGDAEFATLRLNLDWSPGKSDDGDKGWKYPAKIQVDLESNPGRESLRARLDPFYRRLARGGEKRGPAGLKVLTLSARRAPATDIIAYDPTVQNGFIVRCRKDSSSGKARCHRAIVFASGLELRYSFDQSLLPDWRRLDADVVASIEGYQIK
ncbi:hypothetical protein FMN63_23405 [Stappia sp. BW2]|uniref:hypothetical protein n=1 Tax=Stappia sp. BW2 TaxID=2592622 RepID=UPI0011DEAA9F|nr:hypothetical protein [Stappia sp. BW2]TYC65364.1 hypothetical protein FMN63_23405 [Stappia sp. BW2]